MKKPSILVCLQCGSTERNRHGCKITNPVAVQFADEIRQALAHKYPADAPKIDVLLVRCLTRCAEPIAWGLRADELYNYVFAHGGDDPTAVADLAHRWVHEERQGCMPAKKLPPALRQKLRGRLPPFADQEPD